MAALAAVVTSASTKGRSATSTALGMAFTLAFSLSFLCVESSTLAFAFLIGKSSSISICCYSWRAHVVCLLAEQPAVLQHKRPFRIDIRHWRLWELKFYCKFMRAIEVPSGSRRTGRVGPTRPD